MTAKRCYTWLEIYTIVGRRRREEAGTSHLSEPAAMDPSLAFGFGFALKYAILS